MTEPVSTTFNNVTNDRACHNNFLNNVTNECHSNLLDCVLHETGSKIRPREHFTDL